MTSKINARIKKKTVTVTLDPYGWCEVLPKSEGIPILVTSADGYVTFGIADVSNSNNWLARCYESQSTTLAVNVYYL